MNPDVKASDVPQIQITISHDQSHYQMGDEFMKRTEYENSYQLYWCARTDMWSQAQPIVKNDPNIVRIPCTARDDTALHVAAASGSTTFVEELVKLMRPEDLLIPNSDGMLPVHLAALSANRRIVQHFCSQQHLLDKMAYKDIEKLFFMTICNNMFDVAMKLFRQHETELAIARDEENLTALHILARKPSEILLEDNDTEGSASTGMALFRLLWDNVQLLENEKLMALINEPSVVLFDAIKSGNFDATWLLTKNIKLFMKIKDPNNGRNLLHLLVLYRHFDSSINGIYDRKEQIMRAVDNEGNNVLHMAALLPLQFQSFSGLRANMQMQRELEWFKKVEESVPRELRSVRNKKGKRPIDVFYDEHKQLSEEIKGAAKGIAESGMLVATLVATVAFAAALTVPGDKNNAWFIVFIFTNAVALFTSSASILSFLSNFTSSRFAESEFVISLHPSLTFGPALLISSVASMVVAFIAASFLIFNHTTKWVSYLVAPMGVFALLLFVLFQSRFCDEFFWSRYYRPNLE